MGSLDHNPPTADRNITDGGTDWLWAAFAVMLLSDAVMIFWLFMRPRGTRLFHNIAVVILTTAAIVYFSMASNLGSTPVAAEFRRNNINTRQVWFVRYIQWFITFPLLLTLLLLPTGFSFSDILTTAFMGWVVVICGLIGALVPSTYKWGYFVLGMCAMIYLWSILLGTARRTHFASGPAVRKNYSFGSGYLSFFLMLYPICWGLSEGGNVISPTREMIFYGILDIFTGPIFLFAYLWTLRRIEYPTYGLHSVKGPYDAGNHSSYGAPVAGAPVAASGPGMTSVGTSGTGMHSGNTGLGTSTGFTPGASLHTGAVNGSSTGIAGTGAGVGTGMTGNAGHTGLNEGPTLGHVGHTSGDAIA